MIAFPRVRIGPESTPSDDAANLQWLALPSQYVDLFVDDPEHAHPGGAFFMTGPLAEWIIDTVDCEWRACACTDIESPTLACGWITFEDPRIAVMFKYRWHGA